MSDESKIAGTDSFESQVSAQMSGALRRLGVLRSIVGCVRYLMQRREDAKALKLRKSFDWGCDRELG